MVAHIKNIDMNNIVWLIRFKYLKKYEYEYEKANNFGYFFDINGSLIFFKHIYSLLWRSLYYKFTKSKVELITIYIFEWY